MGRTRDVVTQMANHRIVVERRKRNIKRHAIDLSHQIIWETHIGCLLTTRAQSGEGSAVERFIRSTSPLLSLRHCEGSKDVRKLAESELSRFGGIWRTTVIPKQIAHNMNWLDGGGWEQLDNLLLPFGKAPQPKDAERRCATVIDGMLKGFGPKQSRNFLQWLGVTQHEIPIDSRVIKWLKGLGNSDSLCLLSPAALGEPEYYCCIMDAIQQLCADAEVLPCIFDASVFASFEKTKKKSNHALQPTPLLRRG